MPLHLDINKPGYPMEVLEAIAKDGLWHTYENWGLPLPEDAKVFLKGHIPNSGYDWEVSLFEKAGEMSDELLERWINALRSGLVRAELRALLKSRKELIK